MAKPSTRLSTKFDIYDFDHTIYDGDCSIDFYFFCVRKKPTLLAYMPYQLWHYALFVLRLESRTKFKNSFFIFLRSLNDTNKYVEEFWSAHFKKIKTWYKGSDHTKDIIISASPEFLVEPASHRLKVHLLIATRMDPKSGIVDGENCRGEEKVVRLKKALGKPQIRKAYTDSLSDMPILALAKERYIVKGDEVMSLEEYARKSRFKKISLPDPID